MSEAIKQQIQDDMKTAMKSQDKERLAAIRLIMAAFKQVEVDERIVIDDERAIVILSKMVKQRQDSINEYQKANRQDLVDKEQFEIDVIKTYLPTPLAEAEIAAMIKEAIAATDAKTMQDMGKVMAVLKPKVQGRADLGAVSAKLKEHLS